MPEPEPRAGSAEDAALDPEAEAFDAVCRRLHGFDPRVDTEWIDGYLTAVAASWRRIPLPEVLERLVPDLFDRVFADPTDVAQAQAALDARLQTLCRALDPEALLDEPDALRLAPLMQVWDDTARAEVLAQGAASADEVAELATGAVWAEGFLRATDDFAADWPEALASDEAGTLSQALRDSVRALLWAPQDEAFQRYAQAGWKDGQPTRDELIDEACFAVQDLRVLWLDHPPRQVPRRVAAQAGRNDPCRCGSGRKYKRCHGAGT